MKKTNRENSEVKMGEERKEVEIEDVEGRAIEINQWTKRENGKTTNRSFNNARQTRSSTGAERLPQRLSIKLGCCANLKLLRLT